MRYATLKDSDAEGIVEWASQLCHAWTPNFFSLSGEYLTTSMEIQPIRFEDAIVGTAIFISQKLGELNFVTPHMYLQQEHCRKGIGFHLYKSKLDNGNLLLSSSTHTRAARKLWEKISTMYSVLWVKVDPLVYFGMYGTRRSLADGHLLALPHSVPIAKFLKATNAEVRYGKHCKN